MSSTVVQYNGEGDGTPLQYSCLENPMDGGAWWAAVHGVARSRTQVGDFTFTFHFHALEKKMATHSSVLAWRIPGTGESGGLPSMGLQSRTRLKRLSSSIVQQLAYRGCHQVNRQEELLTRGGRGGGRWDGRAEGSSATGDGGQAAISLTPDIGVLISGSLLEPDAHSHLWKFKTWRFVCRGLTIYGFTKVSTDS